MASNGFSGADASAPNEQDVPYILLALSGRDASCFPRAEVIRIHKLQAAVATQLESLQQRLRINMLRNPPRRGRIGNANRLERKSLQSQILATEARIVALEAEARFFTKNPERLRRIEALMFAENLNCPRKPDG
jgi:hypothetical protein